MREIYGFCDLRADLRIRLATLRKSVLEFWFCKLASTWVDLRVRLASGFKRAILHGLGELGKCITWMLPMVRWGCSFIRFTFGTEIP